LAGKEIIAARVVAIDGMLQKEDGLVWEFENLPETAALAEAVRERLRLLPAKKDLPDLLIVDGAKPQINAVIKVLMKFNLTKLLVIGAVKPPQAHNQISHFLIEQTRTRIEFNKHSKALNFLQMFLKKDLDLFQTKLGLKIDATYESIISTLFYADKKEKQKILSSVSKETKGNFSILKNIIEKRLKKSQEILDKVN